MESVKKVYQIKSSHRCETEWCSRMTVFETSTKTSVDICNFFESTFIIPPSNIGIGICIISNEHNVSLSECIKEVVRFFSEDESKSVLGKLIELANLEPKIHSKLIHNMQHVHDIVSSFSCLDSIESIELLFRKRQQQITSSGQCFHQCPYHVYKLSGEFPVNIGIWLNSSIAKHMLMVKEKDNTAISTASFEYVSKRCLSYRDGILDEIITCVSDINFQIEHPLFVGENVCFKAERSNKTCWTTYDILDIASNVWLQTLEDLGTLYSTFSPVESSNIRHMKKRHLFNRNSKTSDDETNSNSLPKDVPKDAPAKSANASEFSLSDEDTFIPHVIKNHIESLYNDSDVLLHSYFTHIFYNPVERLVSINVQRVLSV